MDASKIFGCGIDRQTFEEKINGLSDDQQRLLQKVADRTRLTVLLRYDAWINPDAFTFSGGSWGRWEITDWELPSIEVYLLITCLDTLAGHHGFKDFDVWIKSQVINKDMNKEEIISLYQKYKEEYGISKNLKNLFLNLPDATKAWLSSNVRLRIYNEKTFCYMDDPNHSFFENIFRYFYNIRRNEYTHSSKSRQTLVSTDIYNPTSESIWHTPASCLHFVLDRNKRNQKWIFSYRSGIDEATILRIIIYSVFLQKIGITVTEKHIEAHISHLSRAHIFRAFKIEAYRNSQVLDLIAKQTGKEYSEFKSFTYHGGLFLLSDQATKLAIDRYITKYPLENGLHQMTCEYLNDISHINEQNKEFNINNPCEIPKHGRQEVIDKFLNDLMNDSAIEKIRNWPNRVEMTNLWLVIRDPCYS